MCKETDKNARLLLGLEAGVVDGVRRLGNKSQYWGIEIPINRTVIYGSDLPVGENDLPRLLDAINFEELPPAGKALAVAAAEFVWGSPVDESIVEYKRTLRERQSSGETLTDLEQTALNLGYLDTDMF